MFFDNQTSKLYQNESFYSAVFIKLYFHLNVVMIFYSFKFVLILLNNAYTFKIMFVGSLNNTEVV